jgi:hypothetical protein
VSSLHGITARLPPHQKVLPSVSPREHIPIHPPLPSVPISGLGGGLGGLVDADDSRLELKRGAGDEGSIEDITFRANVGVFGRWGVGTGGPTISSSVTLPGIDCVPGSSIDRHFGNSLMRSNRGYSARLLLRPGSRGRGVRCVTGRVRVRVRDVAVLGSVGLVADGDNRSSDNRSNSGCGEQPRRSAEKRHDQSLVGVAGDLC